MMSLTSITYHILVALGDGPKHGYAIMQDVESRSEGDVRLLPGTLYSNIKKLLTEGAIEECGRPAGEPSDDERRRYYRLTSNGRRAAAAETERLAALVRLARKKGFASAR